MHRLVPALVALSLLIFSGTALAQDTNGEAGEPIAIDSHSLVPVTLELALPSAAGVQTVTVSVTLDVQAQFSLHAGNPATATVVVRAAPGQQSAGGGAEIVGVRVGAVRTEPPAIRPRAAVTGTEPVLPTAAASASQPVAAAPAALVEPPASAADAAAEDVVTVNAPANLRGGPGTDYPVLGRAEAGELVTVTGRSPDGEWLLVAGGAWIAAFLLDGAPEALAIVEDLPPLPQAGSGSRKGWRSYRLISGDAAFSYPSEWEITDEDSNSASLDPTDGSPGSIVVTGSTAVIDFTDSAGAIRSLKSEMADVSDFQFRFLEEGTLALPGSPIYVSASAAYEGRTVGFLAVMAPAGPRTVTLLYMRLSQADVTAEALPLLTEMAATVEP